MPKIKTTILGNYKPHLIIHTGNVIMLKTKEHPAGGLHLISETDLEHRSRTYIDLHTKKYIYNGKKIANEKINKYKIELTEKEIIEFWNNNLKEIYIGGAKAQPIGSAVGG